MLIDLLTVLSVCFWIVFHGCLPLHVFSALYDFLHTFSSCLLALHNTTTHTDPTLISTSTYSLVLFHTSFIHIQKKQNPTSAHIFLCPHVYSLCIAVVAGPSSSSVPDDITDDVTLPSDQSSKPRGKDTAQGNDNQTGQDSHSFIYMWNIHADSRLWSVISKFVLIGPL